MKLSALNNVLAKELAVLCAMNTKISFKSLPDPVAKRMSLEQVIDLIGKARGGWGRRDRHRTEQTSGILTFSESRAVISFTCDCYAIFTPELLPESSEYFTIPCWRRHKIERLHHGVTR
jgi:hypothetical protein